MDKETARQIISAAYHAAQAMVRARFNLPFPRQDQLYNRVYVGLLEDSAGKEVSPSCCQLSLDRDIYPRNMKRSAGLAILALLTACTSMSDVTPAGDGHYTVTTQVRGGMTPWGEVKASSLKRADEYCREKGKQMHQVDMQTHGVRGWTPQEAELTFACVAG